MDFKFLYDQKIKANTCFNLDDEDALYYIREGSVDIFMVDINGQWHHWLRSEAKESFISLFFHESYSFRLLARLNENAEVYKLNIDKVLCLKNKTEEGFLFLSDSLDRYFDKIAQTFRHEKQPKNCIDATDVIDIHIKNKQAVRVLSGIKWFKNETCNIFFDGDRGVGRLKPESWYPLIPEHWIAIEENTIILPLLKTSELLLQTFKNKDVSLYDRFYPYVTMLAKLYWIHLEKDQLYEEILLDERVKNSEHQLNTAYQSLVRSFYGKPQISYMLYSNVPLYQALFVISEYEKIYIHVPSYLEAALSMDEKTKEILSYSNLFYRSVLFNNKENSSLQGPFLGFTLKTHYPVALIPKNFQNYWIYDSREKYPLEIPSSVVSYFLDSFAYVIVKPFEACRNQLKDVLSFVFQKSFKLWITFIGFGLMTAMLGLLNPVITHYIFDDVVMTHNFDQLLHFSFILIGVLIPTLLFEWMKRIALLNLETQADNLLQMGFWDRLLKLPITFFKKHNAGQVMSRMGNLIDIRNDLSGTTLLFVLDLIFIITNVCLILYYRSGLALILLGMLFILLLAYVLISKIIVRIETYLVKYSADNYGVVAEIISAISKIRTAGRESYAFQYWAKTFSQLQLFYIKSQRIKIIIAALIDAVPLLILGVMYILIAQMVSKDAPMSTGTFLAFNTAFGQILAVMFLFFDEVNKLVSLIPLFKQSQEIILTAPEVSPHAKDPGHLHGEIEFSHVSFHYEGSENRVLEDISFTISPGEYVAIVGASGSGKSTLVRLLLGFDKPSQGRLYIDSKDCDYLNMHLVRRQMGIVLQNDELMPGTILSNLLAHSTLTMIEINNLLEKVGLLEDVKKMPMKIHTLINSEGIGISGGQKERLLLARALARKPSLLVLDEAMRALDNPHQRHILNNIKELTMTRIIIAHRLSTLTDVNKIIVLQEGRVVEVGTFDDLMKNKSTFHQLARLQSFNGDR